MDWLADVRLVVVTDRRLMVPPAVLDRGDWPAIAAAFAAAIERATAAAPPGTILVHIREKDLDGAPLLALARAARHVATRLVINDRADVALAADADGVHLPELGLTIAEARTVFAGTDRLIGVSRHDPESAQLADADLVHLGPIWPTPSKAGLVAPLAVAALRAARGRAHLVAIGGIDSPWRARAAREAGADAVAVIRAVWTSVDPAATTAGLLDAMRVA